jgi:hypothetical protein
VRDLVAQALDAGTWVYPDQVVSHWTVISSAPGEIEDSEREHADRLAAV